MEQATTQAVSQGGAITTLADKVTSTEAFILLVILLIGMAMWKVWGEVKHIMLEREHTTEKRNAKDQEQDKEITELKSKLESHFFTHQGIDKKLDSIESLSKEVAEMKATVTGINVKLDVLLERRISKPKLP